MGLGIVHVHVPGFGSGVEVVVELVRPGSDDLLKIVVAELAVIKGVVAEVDGVILIRCSPLNHDRASRLVARIVLPQRYVHAVGDASLNRPLIVDLRGREDSGLRVIVEP